MCSCDRETKLLGFAAEKSLRPVLDFFETGKWSSVLSCGTKQEAANVIVAQMAG